jgi:hypothetical protein
VEAALTDARADRLPDFDDAVGGVYGNCSHEAAAR